MRVRARARAPWDVTVVSTLYAAVLLAEGIRFTDAEPAEPPPSPDPDTSFNSALMQPGVLRLETAANSCLAYVAEG